MTVDLLSTNAGALTASSESDATIGAITGLGQTAGRAVRLGTNCVSWQVASDGGRRFPMPATLDLSHGAFAVHIGHNSLARVQMQNFADSPAKIRLYSGTANYADFKCYAPDTIGVLGDYKAYVVHASATPDAEVGTFNPAAVTHWGAHWGRLNLGGVNSTSLCYISRAMYVRAVAGDASLPKIYNTAEIEDLVDLAFGNGVDTVETFAYSFQGGVAFLPMAIQLGKAGEVSNISMRFDSLTIPAKADNDPRYHTTAAGLAWQQQWQAGDTLDLAGKTFNCDVPTPLACFDSNAGAALNLEGFTLAGSIGSIAFGSDVTGAVTVDELAAGEQITARDGVDVDGWTVAGGEGLRYEGGPTTFSGLTTGKLVITQPGSYTLDSTCSVVDFENDSGGVVTVTTTQAFGAVTNTSVGAVTAVIDSALRFEGVDAWTVYPTEADRDANTNSLGTGSTEDFAFTFAPATTYYLRLVLSGDTFFKAATPTNSGVTSVSLSTNALLSGLSGRVAEVLADTDELQQNQGNFATATGFSTLTAAEVNSEVDSAISDANLATAQSVADLNDPSAAEVAVAVRSELTTELSRIDETIGSRSTLTPAEVNAEVDSALADYDSPTSAELDSATADIGVIRDRVLDIQLNVQQTNN